MLTSIPLKEIMSKRLITLHPKDKMSRVDQIFKDFSIHHIPVVVGNELVGVISKTDFDMVCYTAKNSYDKFVQEKMLKTHSVDEYMHREVYALKEDNTIGDAVEIFLENKIHCLPIVAGKEVVGIVTPYDILKIINKVK